MVFTNAKWIWTSTTFVENEYAEFVETIMWNGSKTGIRISVCGDYTLFINGAYAQSNQYADFEYHKVYDEFDITPLLKNGENDIKILVWYFGKSGMRYLTPKPGLIYEIFDESGILRTSNEDVLSRKSPFYLSGSQKKISQQLSYSFTYDSTKDDTAFTPSCVIQEKKDFYPRPIAKQMLGTMVKGTVISQENNRILLDFGREIVGLCSLSFVSAKKQNINVAYGECLENGRVKRIIGDRDFSFDYISKEGENRYVNYMFRIAARYVEVEAVDNIALDYIGIIPQFYSVSEKKFTLENELDQRIYELCLNSLKLCMMEHYVDCPWREQCMYAYDSRNQMLAGYYAFQNGNADYVKANLLLMAMDDRKDKLLSICFPSGEDLTIPSFSLYYVLAVKEYIEHTGDLGLADAVFAKMESMLGAFYDNMTDGLVHTFSGANHWNFYDWTEFAQSEPWLDTPRKPDFLVNAIFMLSLNAFDSICTRLGRENKFKNATIGLKEKLLDKFYDKQSGTFFIADAKSEVANELGNSLAILLDIVDGDAAELLCEKLAAGELDECTLSMKPFKYDALLKMDKEKYLPVVLDEIRKQYKIMLDAGATTTWETIDGKDAFDNAGSLCHGWSAIPIYYYHKLGFVK
ncbi:MAG: family 78 glycoside hydrolase catalytic domain [Eubacteriales bacterium]|nr:family 78 glycoside hydrolase catalytic domain [Eubacteriales bacterium]